MNDKKPCEVCQNEYGPGITPDGEIKTKGNWENSKTCCNACKAIYCARGNHERAEALKKERERCRVLHLTWWKKFVFKPRVEL